CRIGEQREGLDLRFRLVHPQNGPCTVVISRCSTRIFAKFGLAIRCECKHRRTCHTPSNAPGSIFPARWLFPEVRFPSVTSSLAPLDAKDHVDPELWSKY